jgi:hypothetical protein
LTQLQLVNGASLVSGHGYGYSDGINLTGITDQVAAANSNTLTYSLANRLASASGARGTDTFSYDSVGNRLTVVVTGTVSTKVLLTMHKTPSHMRVSPGNIALIRRPRDLLP